MSIFGIGILTAVIGDVAAHFGCISLVKDKITAITIVALGTSVPGKVKGNIPVNIYRFLLLLNIINWG
jgi:hypothetical protein